MPYESRRFQTFGVTAPAAFGLCAALLAALAISGTAAGARTLEVTETAIELRLDRVTLPSSIVGRVRFRQCESCELESLPVNSGTVWLDQQGPLSLPEFSALADRLRLAPESGQATYLTLFQSTNDSRVTRIRLHSSR